MIEFRNSIYKANHDKQPRGVGLWGFLLRIKNERLTAMGCPFEHYALERGLVIVWASGVMTLAQAKKELSDWFYSQGIKKGVMYIAD